MTSNKTSYWRLRDDTLITNELIYRTIDNRHEEWLRYASTRFDTVRRASTRFDTLRHASTRFDTLWHASYTSYALIRFDTLRRASTRFDVLRRALTRFDALRHASTRFDTLRRVSTREPMHLTITYDEHWQTKLLHQPLQIFPMASWPSPHIIIIQVLSW